jgi:hypothetical protein
MFRRNAIIGLSCDLKDGNVSGDQSQGGVIVAVFEEHGLKRKRKPILQFIYMACRLNLHWSASFQIDADEVNMLRKRGGCNRERSSCDFECQAKGTNYE